MASEWSYTYAVARIRVLETRLLSNNDVNTMAAQKSADAVLAAEERKTLQLRKELKIDPAAFELLSFPNLYHNLKTAIKEICTSESNEEAFYPDEKYGRSEMLRILTEKDYKALPEHMRSAAATAMDVMLQTRDGQKCDIIVDRACLDAIEAAGKASPDKVIRDYAKSQVAVTNIKIAVRSAKTKKSLDFLHKALAPCASFDVRTLAQAAFQGVDALLDYLSSSGYAEAAEALKKSPSAFERWCDNRVIETIKPQKYEVCTVGPLVAYVLARQNEIKTARIVITGKANGLSDEAIRERTREMYV